MVKKHVNGIFSLLAITLLCMGQAFAQDTTELTSIKVAEDKAGDKDGCDKGCNFVWGEDTWLTVGAGLRTSYRATRNPNGAIGGDGPGNWGHNFNIDNARVYLNGRGHDCLGLEFNLDVDNAQNFWDQSLVPHQDQIDSGDIRVLDAIIKFELNDLVNIWMGRMIVPSDRSTLSGMYYLNAGYDFPFNGFMYNNIFQGRDDGAVLWGQMNGGAVKYQIGVFDGVNDAVFDTQGGIGSPSDDPMVAGRFTVNLLDPEPGYYNSSTYHGEKDILAIGYAFQHQNDSMGATAYNSYSFDAMYETTLANGGVANISGAYYELNNTMFLAQDGTRYFMEASYLTAREFKLGNCVSGKIQPFWRHAENRFAGVAGDIVRQTDWGFHYVMFGHNAKATYVYSAVRNSGGASPTSRAPDEDRHTVGIQLQY